MYQFNLNYDFLGENLGMKAYLFSFLLTHVAFDKEIWCWKIIAKKCTDASLLLKYEFFRKFNSSLRNETGDLLLIYIKDKYNKLKEKIKRYWLT